MLKLLSHFEDSKRVYIITELCPNGNLHRYMTLHPNGLSEAQTRGVMQDIVEGVQGSLFFDFINLRTPL